MTNERGKETHEVPHEPICSDVASIGGFDDFGGANDPAVDEVGINGGAIHALWTLHGLKALEQDAKIDVNGSGAHPLYRLLTSARRGILGTARIKWNFTKFLVSASGEVERRYSPSITPETIERDVIAAVRPRTSKTR